MQQVAQIYNFGMEKVAETLRSWLRTQAEDESTYGSVSGDNQDQRVARCEHSLEEGSGTFACH